jgi:hypothetical protein
VGVVEAQAEISPASESARMARYVIHGSETEYGGPGPFLMDKG